MAGTSYKDSGVDIHAGEELIRRVKPAVKATFGPEVVSDLGLFGGAFRLNTEGMEDPVLIASTDGVGTKTKVAEWVGRHSTVGHDLVNHCIDDIFTCGASPLFFLDYYAAAHLNVDTAEEVIKGLAEACSAAGVALLGGETAEMPSVYHEGVYDLAGTIVGIVDRKKLINGEAIAEGDMIIGLPSNGLHTNGYTLARKVLIDDGKLKPDDILPDMEESVGDALLKPHLNYEIVVRPWLNRELQINGMAHITGGGIEGNTKRIMPGGLKAVINWDLWEIPPLFRHIMEMGSVPVEDMRRTFNLGIGWVIIINPGRAKEVIFHAMNKGIKPVRIGKVEKS
ncbi:MAG: phosphoribosylformylglycinamidine cyclo-ligase [Candidatus Electryonea clarkiae]|nr:phosphoribosylformylglycinamidine cyclo-ligase [Candidatus Electryonea clarkiae]MDP8288197.1 phosphoribosylformylglycinamidine cyclo-ligase [Candidatus Electryonea clarkiae]